MIKALVTAEICREELQGYTDRIEFVYKGYTLNHEVLPHKELIKEISDYEILICEYDTIDKAVIDAAKKLKLIICCRGGVSSVIDVSYAAEKGICVCNNLGRNAWAVSELVMGFIICLSRNVVNSHMEIKDGSIHDKSGYKPEEYQDTVWGLDNSSPFIRFRGRSLNHLKLGIIGYGSVGKLVAEKALAFGMEIVTYDPWVNLVPSNVKKVSLDELLEISDVISLHCGVSAETKKMIKKETIDKMKPDAILINTARGELIDEEALVDALKAKRLAGAALDVTVKEPIPADSMLLEAPNLILTPHIAGSSDDVQIVGTSMVKDSLDDFLAGRKMRHAV